MEEIEEWEIRYTTKNSEEMKDLEGKMALLKNYVSVFNNGSGRTVKRDTFNVEVRNLSNQVIVAYEFHHDHLTFCSKGKNGERAYLQLSVGVWEEDSSLEYELNINGTK